MTRSRPSPSTARATHGSAFLLHLFSILIASGRERDRPDPSPAHISILPYHTLLQTLNSSISHGLRAAEWSPGLYLTRQSSSSSHLSDHTCRPINPYKCPTVLRFLSGRQHVQARSYWPCQIDSYLGNIQRGCKHLSKSCQIRISGIRRILSSPMFVQPHKIRTKHHVHQQQFDIFG